MDSLHRLPLFTPSLAQHHIELLRQFSASCANRQPQLLLNSFSIAPKNGSEEENDHTVIDLVHRIAHEHLVGAKAVYGPKCIAHEMPPRKFATTVVPLKLRARRQPSSSNSKTAWSFALPFKCPPPAADRMCFLICMVVFWGARFMVTKESALLTWQR